MDSRSPSGEVDEAPPPWARIAAGGALLLAGGDLALLCVYGARHLWYLLAAVLAAGIGISAAWVALTNRRWRWLALVLAVTMMAGSIAAFWRARPPFSVLATAVGGMVLAGALGAVALRYEVGDALRRRWHDVPAASRPVLLLNPRSGGGKAGQLHLVEECARRGIETVVLRPDDDLESLARAALDRHPDAIGMAGGDGSQALVAGLAALTGTPFVCVPAGTRNHLALDLGVERDDVVGSLDAFGPAREGVIDLATVNDRVFVNNVSLGLYGMMVASAEYRDAKFKTAAQTIEQCLGPDEPPFDLHLDAPDGPVDGAQIVEVSNNPYLLRSLATFGTRSRMDTGKLGVVTVRVEGPGELRRLLAAETARHAEGFPGVRAWTTPALTVSASGRVAAGIDGEAALLDPPVRFGSLPGALRVRIARAHPGLSPAARRAPLAASTAVGLWALVCGRPSGLVT